MVEEAIALWDESKQIITQTCPIREETMLTRCLISILIMSIISVMLGCSGTTPAPEQSLLEKNWGRSFESMRYMQMADPEAGKSLDAVEGMDGNAADYSVKKYQKSFEKTEQKESTTILKLR
jgi:hypothetical protein